MHQLDALTPALACNATAESAANDVLAGKYFQIWDSYPIQQFTTQIEKEWLAQELKPNARVLIVGCGGGRELPIFLEKNCQITALDVSQKMLDEGKKRFPKARVDWMLGNVHCLPRHLGPYDDVVALGAVVNYLKDLDMALGCLRGVMRPGARLIVSCINKEHPTEQGKSAALPDERVRHTYSVPELTARLEANQFRNVRSRGYRFFVDELPPKWNSEFDPRAPYAASFVRLLEIERELVQQLPVRMAKFFWLIAETSK